MRLEPALIVAALAASARADSVTNQVIVSSTQATEANPRATVFTDMLNSSIDIGDDWSVNAGASLTLQGQTPAASRGLAGEIGVSWDSPGKSDLEWSFIAGLDFIHYDIDQGISRVRTDAGSTLTAQQLRQQTVAYCNAHPRIRNCGQSILRVLDGVPTSLDYERFSVGATATLYRDTDVSLLADGYLYDEDRAKIGYFGLAALGRGPGLPIAPLQYRIRPEVQHR